MNYFELMEKYLSNEMTPLERANFEQEMNTNPRLKAEVNTFRDIESFGRIEAMVARQMKRMAGQKQVARPTLRHRASHRIWAAAAVFVLLLLGFFLFRPSQSQLETLLQDPVYAQIKGTQKKIDNDIALAFNQKHFAEAIPLLLKKTEQNPKDFRTMLFLAISYCNIDEPENALKYFDKILKETAINKDEAKYYKAACLVKHNHPDQAKPILEDIVKTDSGKMSTLAKKLLKLL